MRRRCVFPTNSSVTRSSTFSDTSLWLVRQSSGVLLPIVRATHCTHGSSPNCWTGPTAGPLCPHHLKLALHSSDGQYFHTSCSSALESLREFIQGRSRR